MLNAIGGVAQLGTTAPYTAARRLKRSSSDGNRLDYGMAFRFKVRLDDVDTGDWSGCTGLKVDFKPEQLRSGGDYGTSRWLPGEASYPRIVLRRAIDTEGSKKVQEWLKKAAWEWLREAYDDEKRGGTGSIMLYDADNEAVMRWTLRGARPASWSGPDLDAGAGKVALETLELVHRGFVIDVMKDMSVKFRSGDPEISTQKLRITKADGPAPRNAVEFQHNPDKLVFGYSAGGATAYRANAEEGTEERNDIPAGVRTYTFSGLNLVGARTGTYAENLLDWAQKKTPPGSTKTEPEQKVEVRWGEFLKDRAMVITDVAITFTRFLADGKPVRAQLTTLKLQDWPDDGGQGGKNPTSGGVAGRRTHRLTLGESLASVSQETYGSGLRWREIAEANGIDDPARVPPGTLLYLPALVELGGRTDG